VIVRVASHVPEGGGDAPSGPIGVGDAEVRGGEGRLSPDGSTVSRDGLAERVTRVISAHERVETTTQIPACRSSTVSRCSMARSSDPCALRATS
jgi:hypothetical protein